MSKAEPLTTRDLAWFKSSYSGSQGGDCVEVATRPEAVHVRDSKNIAGPMLSVSVQQWQRFVAYASSTV
ncbi:DUF397 domain-containing protein [Streptomyces sp. WM6378]|uniref:DUF397 domain-containing protein n=1 Tax=Streptomyces sp. WM6378 TaxID=1415557 RepID=UPI0006AFAB49|nr:DUF397 domain-containing protein [Streptomyces sp. WM6378]KOU50091.1 hypothetical protein ADK54_10025 [Streptomyces sp. WM6378]